MATAVIFEDQLRIPAIATLSDFRRWALSDSFPDRGRIDFVAGEIEVDMSPENLFFHGTLKSRICATLVEIVQEQELCYLFSDCTRISSVPGNVSAEPDVVFLSDDAIDTGRVTLVSTSSGEQDGYVEIEGPPDLIVEIVSDSSVKKDTERLPAAYFAAGIPEFWLVDARPKTINQHGELQFQIYHRGKTSYQPAVVESAGFQSSAVLNRKFRLERFTNSKGRPAYTLHVMR